jgi:hypothetical protein
LKNAINTVNFHQVYQKKFDLNVQTQKTVTASLNSITGCETLGIFLMQSLEQEIVDQNLSRLKWQSNVICH